MTKRYARIKAMQALGIKPIAYSVGASCACGAEIFETNPSPVLLTVHCECGRMFRDVHNEPIWPEEDALS